MDVHKVIGHSSKYINIITIRNRSMMLAIPSQTMLPWLHINAEGKKTIDMDMNGWMANWPVWPAACCVAYMEETFTLVIPGVGDHGVKYKLRQVCSSSSS